MQARKINSLVIIGVALIVCGLVIIGYYYYNQTKINEHEMEVINSFINNTPPTYTKDEDNYLMVIEIPKVGLKKGIYDFNSKYNSIDYGIELNQESSLPDVENGNVILSSHNGISQRSYFRNLHKLVAEDLVYIYYNGNKYIYKLKEFNDVMKTGTITYDRYKNQRTITLITCKKGTKDQQIVLVGYLDKVE